MAKEMKTFGGYEIVDEKARKMILISPNGTEFKITVTDDGVLSTEKIVEE